MSKGKIGINMDSLKSKKDWKRFKLNDGSNVYRILPPYGDSETHNGWHFKRWSTTWMVDPGTGKLRPFASPLTDSTKNSPLACPIDEYNKAVSKRIKEVEAKMLAKGLSPETVTEKLAGLKNAQWKLKVNHSYLYNAANKQGEVGLLEVKSTAHKGLKTLMSTYITEYNQDPTSLGSDTDENAGVWFNITKSGQKKDTEYKVEFNMIKEKSSDGKVYKVEDRSPLAESISEGYDQLGYDLNTVYIRKSYDELKDVLLYNIALLAKDNPEVAIPGYEVDGIDTSSSEEAEEEIVEVKPKAKISNNKIALKLDDEDDFDDEEIIPVAKKAVPAPVATKPKAKSSFDALAMADEILGE